MRYYPAILIVIAVMVFIDLLVDLGFLGAK